jgi:peptide deformylase
MIRRVASFVRIAETIRPCRHDDVRPCAEESSWGRLRGRVLWGCPDCKERCVPSPGYNAVARPVLEGPLQSFTGVCIPRSPPNLALSQRVMQIVSYPHPALRWKSKPIVRIDADLKQMVRAMFDLMYATNGIGLAANQVAMPLRMFIMNATGSAAESAAEHVFLNPEIVRRKGSAEAEEGCLSLPGLYGQVRRSEKIVVNAFDLEGQEFEMDLEDLEARVVQHESDHIDGILFIDRMTEAARRELDPRLADFEAQFRRQQASGAIPSDDVLERTLRGLEPDGGPTV